MSLDEVKKEIEQIVKTGDKEKRYTALAELKSKKPVPEDVFMAIVRETETRLTPPFALELIQFMEGPKEIDWIIEGLMPAQSLSILAAKPKLGKTLLTFNLAIKTARGEDFLNRVAKQTKTLIIQLEDPPVLIRNRFGKMSACALDGIFIRAGLPMTETDWKTLAEFIIQNEIGLLIIDPLVFAMYGDENDATKVSIFLKKLRDLIFKTGCSILLVHHHRKSPGDHGDQIRGSSAILGAVDVAIELIREDEQTPTATLKVTSRFAALEDEIIKLDVETLTWQSEGAADGYKQRKREDAILEALEDGSAYIEDLETSLNLTKPAFYPDLKRLVAAGIVNETPKEPGKKGGRPKFIYSLAQSERLQNPPKKPLGYKTNTHPDQLNEAKKQFSNLNRNLGSEKSYKTKENQFHCSNCGRRPSFVYKDGLYGVPPNQVCRQCWDVLNEPV